MRSNIIKYLYILILLFIITGIITAEESSLPSIMQFYSPNQKYSLEIIPKGIDQRDSVCRCNYYISDSLGKRQLKSSWALLNPIAPSAVLISNNGFYIITIDDWGTDGKGDRVVVIYDSIGTLTRKFSLIDLVPENEIQKMQIKGNKKIWHGDISIIGNKLIIKSIINGGTPDLPGVEYRTIFIDPQDGKIISRAINEYIPGINDYMPVEVGAKPIKRCYPSYPEQARRLKQQGVVYVKMLVDLDGSVMDALVIKSSGYPLLDSEAITSARKTLFEPGQLDGKPVRVWVAMPIQFALE